MKSKQHLPKWTLAMAIKIRRFDTWAESEADREMAIERGERAYVIPQLDAGAGREKAP
jgi:hypothetical protein